MKMSVFVGTSLDGFIARRDGAYDFLPHDGGEPHGFPEFFASVDTVLLGRNTFDIVLRFPKWFYGKKRVVVLSHRKLDFSGIQGRVEQMTGEPGEVAARLRETGAKHVYVDGGITIQQFLAAGLVDEITVTRVPVLIGEGIPLFGAVPRDIKLRHLGTREFKSGMVTSRYAVLRQEAEAVPQSKSTQRRARSSKRRKMASR